MFLLLFDETNVTVQVGSAASELGAVASASVKELAAGGRAESDLSAEAATIIVIVGAGRAESDLSARAGLATEIVAAGRAESTLGALSAIIDQGGVITAGRAESTLGARNATASQAGITVVAGRAETDVLAAAASNVLDLVATAGRSESEIDARAAVTTENAAGGRAESELEAGAATIIVVVYGDRAESDLTALSATIHLVGNVDVQAGRAESSLFARAATIISEQLSVVRNPDRPLDSALFPMIAMMDGSSIVEDEDGEYGTEYGATVRLFTMVEGEHETLGTKANEVYQRICDALYDDRTLGGVIDDLREISARFTVSQTRNTRGTGALQIDFGIIYFDIEGPISPTDRESALAAFKAAIENNTSVTGVSVREQIIAKFRDRLVAMLPGDEIRRNPNRAMFEEGIAIIDGDQETQEEDCGGLTQMMDLQIIVLVHADETVGGPEYHELLGPRANAKAEEVLAVMRDFDTCDGLIMDLREEQREPAIVTLAHSGATMALALSWAVLYSTDVDDVSVVTQAAIAA